MNKDKSSPISVSESEEKFEDQNESTNSKSDDTKDSDVEHQTKVEQGTTKSNYLSSSTYEEDKFDGLVNDFLEDLTTEADSEVA